MYGRLPDKNAANRVNNGITGNTTSALAEKQNEYGTVSGLTSTPYMRGVDAFGVSVLERTNDDSTCQECRVNPAQRPRVICSECLERHRREDADDSDDSSATPTQIGFNLPPPPPSINPPTTSNTNNLPPPVRYSPSTMSTQAKLTPKSSNTLFAGDLNAMLAQVGRKNHPTMNKPKSSMTMARPSRSKPKAPPESVYQSLSATLRQPKSSYGELKDDNTIDGNNNNNSNNNNSNSTTTTTTTSVGNYASLPRGPASSYGILSDDVTLRGGFRSQYGGLKSDSVLLRIAESSESTNNNNNNNSNHNNNNNSSVSSPQNSPNVSSPQIARRSNVQQPPATKFSPSNLPPPVPVNKPTSPPVSPRRRMGEVLHPPPPAPSHSTNTTTSPPISPRTRNQQQSVNTTNNRAPVKPNFVPPTPSTRGPSMPPPAVVPRRSPAFNTTRSPISSPKPIPKRVDANDKPSSSSPVSSSPAYGKLPQGPHANKMTYVSLTPQQRSLNYVRLSETEEMFAQHGNVLRSRSHEDTSSSSTASNVTNQLNRNNAAASHYGSTSLLLESARASQQVSETGSTQTSATPQLRRLASRPTLNYMSVPADLQKKK